MSTCFEFTDLLEKGLEIESCGMTDVAGKIYVTFVRGNAECHIGKDTFDVLKLLYGPDIYNGNMTAPKAVDYAYMALCGKRFLLDLYTTYGNTWRFASNNSAGSKNADSMTAFFHWLGSGTTRNFNLEKDSNRIMMAGKNVKKERDVIIHTGETFTLNVEFLDAVCRIAKVDKRFITQ